MKKIVLMMIAILCIAISPSVFAQKKSVKPVPGIITAVGITPKGETIKAEFSLYAFALTKDGQDKIQLSWNYPQDMTEGTAIYIKKDGQQIPHGSLSNKHPENTGGGLTFIIDHADVVLTAQVVLSDSKFSIEKQFRIKHDGDKVTLEPFDQLPVTPANSLTKTK